MIQRIFIGLFVIFTATLICSCQNNGKLVKVQAVDSGISVMTTADVRAIHQIKVADKIHNGRINPEYIICAEPSPDVAKAVSDALNFAASADLQALNSKINPKLAATLSKARAEGVAQLTERLATIQLLRDTLYRACEAYANGAISANGYTVMLSRYDDIMITMLLGEFAAGGYGRSLATIALEAGGNTSLPFIEMENNGDSTDSQENSKELQNKLSDLQNKLEKAKKSEGDSGSSVKELEKQINSTKDKLIKTLQTEAKSFAKVSSVTGVGDITGTQNIEIAKTLAVMQRKYLENLNSDALDVTCIETLFEDEEAPPGLKEYCLNYLTESCKFKKDALTGNLINSETEKKLFEKNRQRIENSINELNKYLEVIEQIQLKSE